MENIKIIDNFFSDNDVHKITTYFKTVDWVNYIKAANDVSFLKRDMPYWKTDLTTERLFSIDLNKILSEKIKKKFITKRIYAVSQCYGQDSNFHYDDKMENRFTILFYLNENYSEDKDGYFYIKIPNKKHILNIEPVTNRLIIFPSNYFHKGSSFKITEKELRICIAWKLEEYK
jgi:hypothetical protein